MRMHRFKCAARAARPRGVESAPRGRPAHLRARVCAAAGHADEVSCALVQVRRQGEIADEEHAALPRAYKCLAWGTVGECMAFLVRRLVENRGSVDRATEWLRGLKRELWRRVRAGARRE